MGKSVNKSMMELVESFLKTVQVLSHTARRSYDDGNSGRNSIVEDHVGDCVPHSYCIAQADA